MLYYKWRPIKVNKYNFERLPFWTYASWDKHLKTAQLLLKQQQGTTKQGFANNILKSQFQIGKKNLFYVFFLRLRSNPLVQFFRFQFKVYPLTPFGEKVLTIAWMRSQNLTNIGPTTRFHQTLIVFS